LDEGEPRQRCPPTRGQQRKEVALARQFGELPKRCLRIGMPAASLLQTSE
jgi:hypothetical protein